MEAREAKILVVDDNAATRALYREWVHSVGEVSVLEANGGQAALEIAATNDLAMVVLDINMPDMDGFETAAMLREDADPHRQPPILFISNEFPSSKRVKGYRMGAVDCLVTEPMNPEILAQKARVFIRLWEKRKELEDLVSEAREQNAKLHHQLSDYMKEREKLRQEVTRDLLTQIPNRVLFKDRIESAINRAVRSRHMFAVALVDLDGFKLVNDRHGHGTGDELIKAVARRLQEGIRATDTVGRLGGDEFGLLFEGLDSPAAAEYLAEKVLGMIREPIQLVSEQESRAIEVEIGASIGVAMFPDQADTEPELTRMADVAMYAAKRAGGGVQAWRPVMGVDGAEAEVATET